MNMLQGSGVGYCKKVLHGALLLRRSLNLKMMAVGMRLLSRCFLWPATMVCCRPQPYLCELAVSFDQ